jgi:hypothetical protein
MMTWEEIRERAEDDHEEHADRLIRVRGCQIGGLKADDDGEYEPDPEYLYFRKGLWVVVGKKFDYLTDTNESAGLLDATWEAEALPGQLSPGEYVCWIDGPTYYLDGRRETPSWMEVGEKVIDLTLAD